MNLEDKKHSTWKFTITPKKDIAFETVVGRNKNRQVMQKKRHSWERKLKRNGMHIHTSIELRWNNIKWKPLPISSFFFLVWCYYPGGLVGVCNHEACKCNLLSISTLWMLCFTMKFPLLATTQWIDAERIGCGELWEKLQLRFYLFANPTILFSQISRDSKRWTSNSGLFYIFCQGKKKIFPAPKLTVITRIKIGQPLHNTQFQSKTSIHVE